MQIFFARLLVFVVVVIYDLIFQFVPEVGLALLVVFFFLFPWLIGRALRVSRA